VTFNKNISCDIQHIIAHFVTIHQQTWPPQAILVSDWPIFKNLLLWNRLAKWTETWKEASMEGPLYRFLDRDKMSSLYKGPSIDASYQVSIHLADGFQRRRLKCEKLTDDGCQVMAKAIKSNNHWREIVPQIAYVKCKDFVTPTHDFGVSLFSYYHCQGFFSPNTFGITPMGMFCWMSHEGLND
jgi:hypothetical protein